MDKSIEYILEVARCGGITKAAHNLYITPSALSKYIQVKEKELNVKLFVRDGKRFYLSYAGERYVEMLKRMAHYQEEMAQEMERIANMCMGRLRIGFQMSLAETVIQKIVHEFQTCYPHIPIFMEEGSSYGLIKLLRENNLDVVFSVVSENCDGLEVEEILQDNIVLVAPKGSSLRRKAKKDSKFPHPWLPMEAYENEKMVLYSNGLFFRQFSDRQFEENHKETHANITVKTTKTALMCVEMGMGIAFTSELLIHQLHYEDKLDLFSYGKYPIVESMAVIYSQNHVLFEEIQNLIHIAKEQFNIN